MATQNPAPKANALELAGRLKDRFAGLISEPVQFRDEVSLNVAELERITDICRVAKDELGFDFLVDITSIDNYGDDPRFTIVYHLYGYGHLRSLRLKIPIG